MSLEILTYPNPLLATNARDIPEVTDAIRKLAQDMAQVMYTNEGIGLAAPQVGQLVRLIVVDVTGPQERKKLFSLVNPVVHIISDELTEYEEGCLSVPHFRTNISRPGNVMVSALDLSGAPVEIEAEGLLAVCLQHEIDHLNGTLILDHTSRFKRSLYERKVKKWIKQRNST